LATEGLVFGEDKVLNASSYVKVNCKMAGMSESLLSMSSERWFGGVITVTLAVS
jgi:hypothetical protein